MRATAPINHHQAAAHATRARRTARERADRATGDREFMAKLRASGEQAVIDRLANFIVSRAAGVEGNCTKDDLEQAGFTEEDMKLLPKARRAAAKQAPGLQGGS